MTISESHFQQWKALLEMRTGIDFTNHPSILISGLKRAIRENEITDIEHYFEKVTQGTLALKNWLELVDYLTVTETQFYRQKDAMKLIKDYLSQPNSLAGVVNKTLNVWSVGCSSGEEPYSLAMLIDSVLETHGRQAYWGILASDINQAALTAAKKGTYSSRKISNLPDDMQKKYFIYEHDTQLVRVSDLIKQKVCFVRNNVLEINRSPLFQMDIIFCQNLLVYFKRWRIHQVLNEMVKRLKPNGLLILGPGEAVGWHHPQVEKVDWSGVQAFLRRK